MAKDKMIRTSVMVSENRFNEFKIQCIRDKFTFTALANKAMDLYLTDEDFRKFILNHQIK